MQPLFVPKLDIPVFTNMGFQSFNLHVYVDNLEIILPDMHPRSAVVVHGYLAQMHSAFDQYDMKRFKRLQNLINSVVQRDLLMAEETGEAEVASKMNYYFIQLRYMLRMMRDPNFITKDTQ